ncbi:MAG: long-chain-fatty-acid--CoA ligase [Pseudonocardiaceae bacterium]
MSRIVDAVLVASRLTDRGLTVGAPGEPRNLLWAQVHERARCIASALVERGLAKRATIAVLASDPEIVAMTVQGAWLAGSHVAMLHQPTARTEWKSWIAETVKTLRMISADVVLLGSSFASLASTPAFAMLPCVAIADLASAPISEVVGSGEEDTAIMQLTSGSTAEPKAIVITHGNLFSNLTSMICATGVNVEREVFMSWLPLFHDMGMMGFLVLPMAFGTNLVSIRTEEFVFRPIVWAQLISTYQATVTAGTDFSYVVLGRELAGAEAGTYDLSTLRIALNGGDPIDVTALQGFTAEAVRFGMDRAAIFPAYGLAEATLAVSFVEPSTGLRVDRVLTDQLEHDQVAVPARTGGNDTKSRTSSTRTFPLLGKPLPGVEVKIVTESGRECSEREVGELWLRGPSIARRYLTVDGPIRTQRHGDGWVATGDLGYRVNGEIVICGRITDVITVGGRRLYPTDIERVAAGVTGVRTGNVVTLRLDEGARRERFAVVLESRSAGDPAAEDRIQREVGERVAATVGIPPDAVLVLPPGALPKTTSGKLRRAATKSLFSSQLPTQKHARKDV